MAERKEGLQGEGDRESARRFNEEARRFAESGKVDEKAEEARAAVEGEEGAELAAAEREGTARAREFDPNVARDFTHPTAEDAQSGTEAAQWPLRARIDELERQIDQLAERSKEYSAEARLDVERQVELLRQKTEEIRSSVGGLQSSTSEAWRDISGGLTEAWRSLERAFKQAGGRFR